MKVLLVNGSPHKAGCTNKALEVLVGTLSEEGIGRIFTGLEINLLVVV